MIDVPAPTETTVSLAAGTHSLRTSVEASASLRPFPSMVRDCHAFDGRIFWQAGLRMTKLRSMRGHSVRLRAFAHSACTVQTVDGFVPGGTYLLSMDARATHGRTRDPVGARSGGLCPDPEARGADGWIRYEETYTPRPGTAGLRLFLYADGGKDETGPTIVDYRNVRIRMLAPFAVSITEGADPRPAPPEVTSARVGPSSFRAEVGRSGGPFLLSIPSPPRRDGRSPAYPPDGR